MAKVGSNDEMDCPFNERGKIKNIKSLKGGVYLLHLDPGLNPLLTKTIFFLVKGMYINFNNLSTVKKMDYKVLG